MSNAARKLRRRHQQGMAVRAVSELSDMMKALNALSKLPEYADLMADLGAELETLGSALRVVRQG